jgi:proteic killer suppression protein
VAIARFKHKGLEIFFHTGSTRGIQVRHAGRLRLIMGRLNVAQEVRDMALPGLGLHTLKGDRHTTWAVRVSGNWRLTFRFEDGVPTDVDLEDYH